MKVVNMKLDQIKPYEKNPRKISNDAIEKVANSIKEFGFQQPIVVDKDNIIIVGHTRFLAAQTLGLIEVPVVVAKELTEEQVKAYRLADNRVAEFSEWDDEKLSGELNGILGLNMEDFGFFKVFEDIDDEVPPEPEPEIKFAEYLGEENNYVVLQFKNDVDWLQAQSLLKLETVKAYPTRKDGKEKGKMVRAGIGRVLDGREVLDMIVGGKV